MIYIYNSGPPPCMNRKCRLKSDQFVVEHGPRTTIFTGLFTTQLCISDSWLLVVPFGKSPKHVIGKLYTNRS